MIKIKEIIWECKNSGWSGDYYIASIEKIAFIMIPKVDDRFYIHPTSPLVKISGNKGLDEWGWFSDIEACKIKSEEIISNAILSLIDIRDYNIKTLLNKNAQRRQIKISFIHRAKKGR